MNRPYQTCLHFAGKPAKQAAEAVGDTERGSVVVDAKMTTAPLDRLCYRCHILEPGDDSYCFKAISATTKRKR